MSVILNFNDMVEKMFGNNEEIRIKGKTKNKDLVIINAKKFDEIIARLKELEYWQEMEKRSDELAIGKGEIHSISEMKKMLEVIK